ncbi:MAG: hypothetical protein K8R57_02925 [Verrucomicrobia bacterium]|nr:hypothetical protein [Verrucomicrobiota bacterium]
MLLLLLSFQSLRAAGGGKPSTLRLPSPTPSTDTINQPLSASSLRISQKALFMRVIQARLFHDGIWTLGDASQTPVTVARTIASLHPSFVTGLLRIVDHGALSHSEEEAFSTVRSAVQASSKGCRFDVVLNAAEERSGDLIIRHMKEITTRIHPDAWTFYVSPNDTTVNPEVFEQGIAAAHAAGQMVGYDGPLSLVPEGIDYLVVRAWDLKVSRHQIDLLKAANRVPLIVELPTTFGAQPSPEVSSYVNELSPQDRAASLTSLAENQSAWGYRFAYPVFYPLCPTKHAFDATKDPILMVTIRSLLTRLN